MDRKQFLFTAIGLGAITAFVRSIVEDVKIQEGLDDALKEVDEKADELNGKTIVLKAQQPDGSWKVLREIEISAQIKSHQH